MDEYTWEKKSVSSQLARRISNVLFAYQHILNTKVRQNTEDKANIINAFEIEAQLLLAKCAC